MATLGAMWIKICGITSADAVSAAAAAQVDAIGFVFAPSPRQVTPGQAAQLAALAPPGILRIAVAQHPLQMKVDEICRVLKPDYFQTDVEDLRELKIPAHIKVLPVRALRPQDAEPAAARASCSRARERHRRAGGLGTGGGARAPDRADSGRRPVGAECRARRSRRCGRSAST